MPCTHGCYAQLPHMRCLSATRVQAVCKVKPLLLPGSQRAGPLSFVPHAVADDSQPSRAQSSSRARPPLQRQRPGPQRPMDARQRRQRPQRETPPLRHEPHDEDAKQGSKPPAQGQAASNPQRRLQQRKVEDKIAPVGSPPRQMTAVHFCLQFDTQYGQRIRLVGSHDSLGQSHVLSSCCYWWSKNVFSVSAGVTDNPWDHLTSSCTSSDPWHLCWKESAPKAHSQCRGMAAARWSRFELDARKQLEGRHRAAQRNRL